jgi:RimJ/RimL family protein N-acetyltransferase
MAAIRLEPLSEAHLQPLADLVHDPGVQRFTRIPVPVPLGFERTWLSLYEEGRREGTREAFAIVEDDEVVGVAVAPQIDVDAQTAELGYVVAPAARGRGVATEALRLLTDWAFFTLGALRLELLIGSENVASKRVAERCGYIREGVLRSLYLKPGVREDTELWSRLPSDPAPGTG